MRAATGAPVGGDVGRERTLGAVRVLERHCGVAVERAERARVALEPRMSCCSAAPSRWLSHGRAACR